MKNYLNLHVIRKMREIVNDWFNIDIYLLDATGRVVGVDSNNSIEATHPLFKSLFQNENCAFMVTRNFIDLCKKLKKEGPPSSVKFLDSVAGLKRLAVPIYLNGDFQGCVTAEGIRQKPYMDQEVQKILSDLPDRNINRNSFADVFKKAPVLTDNNLNYIKDLVKFVVEEITEFQKEISVKDKQISELNEEIGCRYKFDAIIGRSKSMVQVYRLLDKVIDSESTVLIYGENGTGKELVAKAIHYNSRRKDKMFVVQNCSAFNDNLLDSELFGHMKGSFTGAVADKKGLFEIADKGTFFLDEIGDMSPALQVKLLRVLQEGTFIGVGDTKLKTVNVRILAATNKDLKELVETGVFREDLYYRVNVISIRLPPLRERKEDIPILVEHFLFKYCEGKTVKKRLSKKCMERLFEYDFRELENEIERLVVLSDEEPLIHDDLLSPRIMDRIRASRSNYNNLTTQGEGGAPKDLGSLPDAVENLEREIIEEGLKKTRWNKSKLARKLGISRRNLIRKIEKYELDKRRRM